MVFLGEHGLGAAASVFLVAALPFWVFVVFSRRRLASDTYVVITTIWGVLALIGETLNVAYDLGRRDWEDLTWTAISIAITVWFIYDAWRRWKDRKKVLAAIGAKSRARLARLLRNLHEAQPEGAR